jgi:hypothetical protein
MLVAVSVVVAFLIKEETAEARDWAIECDEDYNQCGGSNLPNSCDLTDHMINEMNDSLPNWHHGWYFKGEQAWPHDWRG